MNNLCQCNMSIVEYFKIQIRDLAAKLATFSTDIDIYDPAGRLPATKLLFFQLLRYIFPRVNAK